MKQQQKIKKTDLYKEAKKHKFIKALKKYIESKDQSFDEYLYYRYINRIGSKTCTADMKQQAVIIETISLYMMATHASKEKLETMRKHLFVK